MPKRDAILYLPGQAGVEAAAIRDLLTAADEAHAGLIAFDRLARNGAVLWLPDTPLDIGRPPFAGTPRRWDRFADSLVLEDERLIVASVELSSPGVWAFLGALNPLETMRKYLCDRHQRRQDREYREDEERRRLKLENDAREIEVLRERLRLAREYGVPDEIAAVLLQRLVGQPLQALGVLQDRQLISGGDARVEQLDARSDT